jgi:hypothetical protein
MAAIATWQFYQFVGFRDAHGLLSSQGGTLHLWLAIGTAVVACMCGFLGIFRHINKTDELHITTI